MGTPAEGGEVQGGNEPVVEAPETPGPNPAWNDVLGVLPEQFHSVVTPHFQKWDQEAQKRIEQANQTVTQFEPYKPFLENGIAPEDMEQGLQFLYELNTNPKAVYEAIAQAYGYQNQPAAEEIAGEEEEEEAPDFQDPRFDQLQQGLDLVAQTILQQKQNEINAQAEAQIDSEINELKAKYPGISEEFALSLMVNGFEVNEVGSRWETMTQGILQQNPRPFAPNVMGTNGGGTGLPSQSIDPTKLDGPARRNLVAQMLKQANLD